MGPQDLEILFDTRISEHLSEVRLLREQRNAGCSKTRNLPTELLTKIFCILEHSARDPWCDYLSEWVGVTHVCRTWRTAALDEPRLWANLVLAPLKWVPELLARSKSAPLGLRFGDGARSVPVLAQIFDTAVASPERIAYLEIDSHIPLLSYFTRPAPLLELLEIRANDAFPPDFLGGWAPRLRHVKSSRALPLQAGWLDGVVRLECEQVHFEAPWLAQLTTLELSEGWDALDAASGVVQRLNVDTLLSALENMPLLQRLSLAPPHSFDAAPCTRATPLHLPHLHSITVTLGDKCEAMATLFDALTVDALHTLETVWPKRRWFDEGAAVGPIARFVDACYDGPALRVLRCTDEDTEFSSACDPYIVPALSFREYHPTWATFAQLLPRCRPRVLVTYIQTVREDSRCLRLVQELERTHIEELCAISYGSVFRILFKSSNGPEPSFPSLRRIHIEGLSDYDLVRRLKLWIALRQPVANIEHLVVKGCSFSEEEMELLRKIPRSTVVTILP
ncbi:hypothetical protein EYR38_006295 [Pleurotus pulmonarius]|nr:hypothetical protein EYR38_006295 [Pleurotus pulmonarius]